MVDSELNTCKNYNKKVVDIELNTCENKKSCQERKKNLTILSLFLSLIYKYTLFSSYTASFSLSPKCSLSAYKKEKGKEKEISISSLCQPDYPFFSIKYF